jgi:hypothetical protein
VKEVEVFVGVSECQGVMDARSGRGSNGWRRVRWTMAMWNMLNWTTAMWKMSYMIGVEIEDFQSLRQMGSQNVSVLGEVYPSDEASPLDIISNQK